MQMVGQHHLSMYRERMPSLYVFDCAPQFGNMPHQKVIIFPLQQVDGKKVGAAWMPELPVVHFLPSNLFHVFQTSHNIQFIQRRAQ
jgi:hypothetical protein